MKPEISIIIPCYNSVKTLDEAVTSCYSQGLNSFEIVIVDDGSNDGTRELIKKLALDRKFITYIFHEKNKGGGAARNTAAKHSKSDLIYCLDSDNILAPNTLSKMYAYQKKIGCDGVGIHKSIKFKNTNKNDIEKIDVFGYIDQKIPFISLLQENNSLCPLYATFLITREAFNSIGGYPEHHGFDTQGMAWRFLAKGLNAYTCPGTQEFHRINFTESYYLREANTGKVNYNWQDIFFEHFCLFSPSAKEFIRTFDCKNFTRNIFDELKKRGDIFREDYIEFIGKPCEKTPTPLKRVYVKKESLRGYKYRITAKLKNILKKNNNIRSIIIELYTLFNNFKKLLSERNEKKRYYENIDKIRKEKKIVIELKYGGLGDCLVYTSLPRLLKETYDIEFYLSESSRHVFRHQDILKLCFELNPFFKGFDNGKETFIYNSFISELPPKTFFTGRGGKNIIEMLEYQFDLPGVGLPEIFYEPKLLPDLVNKVLMDKNWIFGKTHNLSYNDNLLENELDIHSNNDRNLVVIIDPKAQDLFRYIDMIHSSKYFIALVSGSNALAAALRKPATIIIPENLDGGSLSNFLFTRAPIEYKRSRSLLGYNLKQNNQHDKKK